ARERCAWGRRPSPPCARCCRAASRTRRCKATRGPTNPSPHTRTCAAPLTTNRRVPMNYNHTLEQLRALRLTGMAEAFSQQMTDAVFASLSFEQRVQMLVEAEHTQRGNQRYQRILKNAKLKVIAAP